MRYPALLLLLLLLAGCTGAPARPVATAPPFPATWTPAPGETRPGASPSAQGGDAPAGWLLYLDEPARLAFHYPPHWQVEAAGERRATLLPTAAQGWAPGAPADLAADPALHLLVGSLVRERYGPAFFPAEINPATLRGWLEGRVASGEARALGERTIGGEPAFELVEAGESGCERVLLWRPASLESLVRLSTGCASPYLPEVEAILATLDSH